MIWPGPTLCKRFHASSESACLRPEANWISKRRYHHPLAPLHRGLVCADPYHRPVRARCRVRHRRLLAANGHEPVVREVRVAAAVAAALDEREMLRVLDRRRLRELADRLG